MQVKIIETGIEEELCAIDARTGCEWTRDLIGNHNGFNDGQFTKIEDTGIYACDQATYDWWKAVIDNFNEADELVKEAKERGICTDDVEREYQAIGNCDLDDQAAAAVAYLRELIGKGE